MGIENNECVIGTTWSNEKMDEIRDWVKTLSAENRSLFAFIPSLINDKYTVVLGPNGSKKGWDEDLQGKHLRDELIALFIASDNVDGSNPFDWIEVGYGEYGQKVLRGNCRNRYGEDIYCED